MSVTSTWPRNRLLLALPARVLKQVIAELEHIECRREQMLIDADSFLDHVYFPDSGVISVVAVYPDGNVIEMATVGREGGTGFQAFFGARVSSVRLYVQVPGTAAKMSNNAFQKAMEVLPQFRQLMQAHVHAFLEQVMVSAACNGAHGLKQRLARWLLMMRDRHDEDVLPVTHDLLAKMLGVQRPSVSHAIGSLQRAGVIQSSRSRLTIRSREGLMQASCECYVVVRNRIAHHLPKTYPEP
jgi:CRP-like cAMP-binding protein